MKWSLVVPHLHCQKPLDWRGSELGNFLAKPGLTEENLQEVLSLAEQKMAERVEAEPEAGPEAEPDAEK